MDGVKVSGGNGEVGIDHRYEDIEGGMQCSEHPYRKNPGGICAFCLQEKLGKLVSSSSPIPLRGFPSSSFSSPSFRCDFGTTTTTSVHPKSTKMRNTSTLYDTSYQEHQYVNKLPFLQAKKKKLAMLTSSQVSSSDTNIVYNRSKSTASGRSESPRRRRSGLWSFLYKTSQDNNVPAKSNHEKADRVSSVAVSPTTNNVYYPNKSLGGGSNLSRRRGADPASDTIEENNSSNTPESQATASSACSLERKVSRSRSVGCGSGRSFSGDLFERISTGFGDCTLRRVESHREGMPKVPNGSNIKESVRCGGIFTGLVMNSSSSYSSLSWVSSSTEDLMNGKSSGHGRIRRSWGWAFASPIRAFTKPAAGSKDRNIIREASTKNSTPNLDAIPSLLAVGG